MYHPASHRTAVLDTFAAAPDFWHTESMIVGTAKKALPGNPDPDHLRAALAWLVTKGRVETRWNTEDERNEWRLTPAGKGILGLA